MNRGQRFLPIMLRKSFPKSLAWATDGTTFPAKHKVTPLQTLLTTIFPSEAIFFKKKKKKLQKKKKKKKNREIESLLE